MSVSTLLKKNTIHVFLLDQSLMRLKGNPNSFLVKSLVKHIKCHEIFQVNQNMPTVLKYLHSYAAAGQGWLDFYYHQSSVNQVLGPDINTSAQY